MAEERDRTPEDPELERREPLGEVEPEVEQHEGGEPPPLDPEVEARRAAAMSFIRRLGDPVLKSRATPVDRFDESLSRQVDRMAGSVNDALGVGLAAPQLGISQRLLVYRVGHDAPVIALANPEVEWESPNVEPGEEGCLSIPGVTFAAVDWVMTLEPHWFSTIWGLLFVAGWALSCAA